MIRKAKLGILALLLILTSCAEQPMYEKVYSFDNRQWNIDEKPEYVVEITDTSSLYNITLTLRTTTDYKYSNLWVFLTTEIPNGDTERKPFQIRIANEDGSWIGRRTGTVVETDLTFASRKLPMKGKYSFTVEQGITESMVDEVLDLGLRIEKVKTD